MALDSYINGTHTASHHCKNGSNSIMHVRNFPNAAMLSINKGSHTVGMNDMVTCVSMSPDALEAVSSFSKPTQLPYYSNHCASMYNTIASPSGDKLVHSIEPSRLTPVYGLQNPWMRGTTSHNFYERGISFPAVYSSLSRSPQPYSAKSHNVFDSFDRHLHHSANMHDLLIQTSSDSIIPFPIPGNISSTDCPGPHHTTMAANISKSAGISSSVVSSDNFAPFTQSPDVSPYTDSAVPQMSCNSYQVTDHRETSQNRPSGACDTKLSPMTLNSEDDSSKMRQKINASPVSLSRHSPNLITKSVDARDSWLAQQNFFLNHLKSGGCNVPANKEQLEFIEFLTLLQGKEKEQSLTNKTCEESSENDHSTTENDESFDAEENDEDKDEDSSCDDDVGMDINEKSAENSDDIEKYNQNDETEDSDDEDDSDGQTSSKKSVPMTTGTEIMEENDDNSCEVNNARQEFLRLQEIATQLWGVPSENSDLSKDSTQSTQNKASKSKAFHHSLFYEKSYDLTQSLNVEKPFKCVQCVKTFSKRSLFKRHLKVHTGEKNYICRVCNKAFSRVSNLARHSRLHTGDKPLKCEVCKKAFMYDCELVRHMTVHADDKRFKCEMCEKSFTQRSSLQTHMRLHTGDKPYRCSECSVTFTYQGQLVRHMTTHTNELPHKCEVCGKTFSDKSSYTRHSWVHVTDKPHKCNQCSKSYSSENDLLRHMNIHSRSKSFKCNECGRHFSQQNNLTRHLRMHSEDKPYKCGNCEKSFIYPGELSRHATVHNEDQYYKCKVCGNLFSQKSSLTTHMRIHTGLKPYKCTKCSQSFAYNSQLFRHTRAEHAEDNILICFECGETFTHQSSFNLHVKLHNLDKVYTCDQCGKSFTAKSGLTKHLNVHSREKLYTCEECGKEYSHQSNLARHMRLHSGTRPYKCDHCEKTYMYPGELVKHMNTHVNQAIKTMGPFNKLKNKQIKAEKQSSTLNFLQISFNACNNSSWSKKRPIHVGKNSPHRGNYSGEEYNVENYKGCDSEVDDMSDEDVNCPKSSDFGVNRWNTIEKLHPVEPSDVSENSHVDEDVGEVC